jgi:AraC-like DNA-binding protein
MAIRFHAGDEPPETRLDYWQHVMASSIAPYQIRTPDGSISSQIQATQMGPITVVDLQCSAMELSRTPDLIRKSDQGLYKIDLGTGGRGVYEQDGRESLPVPGDFHLMDLSRPSHVAIHEWHEGSAVIFPRALLPVRDKEMSQLTAVRFSARDPYAGLVTSLVSRVHGHLDDYDSAHGARIGTAFLDLLALAVATRLDRFSAVPPDSRQRATMIRIRAFIEHHLDDPALSPRMIAAAHHISIRTLHKLYETEGDTIAASIRHRRLERCRRDLLQPSLSERPVGAVGARWGFPDAAAFSRAFRKAYGAPPGEYRAIHGPAAALAARQ